MAQQSSTPNFVLTDHESRDRQLFEEIADAYCRKDLLLASRLARKHRLDQTLRVVPLPPEADVLEIGCGAGFAARFLDGRISSYWGVDYSHNLIEYARVHNAGPGVRFSKTNIKHFSPGALFDVILLIGVLHHLDDMDTVLHHLVALLKPGGWLVANEPQLGNPLISFARAVRRRIDRGYSCDQQELSGAQVKAAYQRVGIIDVKVVPQGLFSTPFAEVPMRPQWFFLPFAMAACFADNVLERSSIPILYRVAWNLIVAGRRPAS